MKKIIKAIVALFAIGAFILATQISCQKTSAQTSGSGTTTSGKVLYWQYGEPGHDSSYQVPSGDSSLTKNVYVGAGSPQLWYCNLDGSSPVQVNLPTNYTISSIQFTPGDASFIFNASYSGGQAAIYSMNLDGSNVHQLVSSGAYGVGLNDVR